MMLLQRGWGGATAEAKFFYSQNAKEAIWRHVFHSLNFVQQFRSGCTTIYMTISERGQVSKNLS